MASPSEHREKAARHLRFLDTISDEFPEWLATVAFYVAVEFVEELLGERGYPSDSHFERKKWLCILYPNQQLNAAYGDLYNSSLNARYLPTSKCPSVRQVREHLIGRRLKMIIEYAAAHRTPLNDR